jgi:hypothetical protein
MRQRDGRRTALRGAAEAGRCEGAAARVRSQARAAWALATAAVVYNSWVLGLVLPTGLDPRHSYVSELYAVGQPFRALFSGAEVLCAALVGAGACTLAAGSGVEAAGWWALFAFAVCSVADVAVPMACAPSVDAGCRAVHPWHTVTSALVHFTVFASMALLSVAARSGREQLRHVGRRGPWLLAGALVSAVSTVGALFGLQGWHGAAQRLHLLLIGAWLLLLAQALSRPRDGVRVALGERPGSRGRDRAGLGEPPGQ